VDFAQGLGVGKVQEFETVLCPTLRSYKKAGMFPNPLKNSILLTRCLRLTFLSTYINKSKM
jgi:hypothetical protein